MEQFTLQIWGDTLSRLIRNWRKQSVTFAKKSLYIRAIWWGTTRGSMTPKNKYIRQQTLLSQILFDNFNQLIPKIQIWEGMLSRFIRNWRKQSVTFAERSLNTRAIWWNTTIESMTPKNKNSRQQTLMSQILFDNFN